MAHCLLTNDKNTTFLPTKLFKYIPKYFLIERDSSVGKCRGCSMAFGIFLFSGGSMVLFLSSSHMTELGQNCIQRNNQSLVRPSNEPESWRKQSGSLKFGRRKMIENVRFISRGKKQLKFKVIINQHQRILLTKEMLNRIVQV